MEIELHVRNVAHHHFLVFVLFLSFFDVYSFWLFFDISGYKTAIVEKLNIKKRAMSKFINLAFFIYYDL